MDLGAILLSIAVMATATPELPATADYAPHEDVSCRKDAPPIFYPPKLRKQGLGGLVMFRVSVDTDGRFLTAVVEKSSGHPELDAAGLEILPFWCYRAGRKGGVAVGGDLLVPIRFTAR